MFLGRVRSGVKGSVDTKATERDGLMNGQCPAGQTRKLEYRMPLSVL